MEQQAIEQDEPVPRLSLSETPIYDALCAERGFDPLPAPHWPEADQDEQPEQPKERIYPAAMGFHRDLGTLQRVLEGLRNLDVSGNTADDAETQEIPLTPAVPIRRQQMPQRIGFVAMPTASASPTANHFIGTQLSGPAQQGETRLGLVPPITAVTPESAPVVAPSPIISSRQRPAAHAAKEGPAEQDRRAFNPFPEDKEDAFARFCAAHDELNAIEEARTKRWQNIALSIGSLVNRLTSRFQRQEESEVGAAMSDLRRPSHLQDTLTDLPRLELAEMAD